MSPKRSVKFYKTIIWKDFLSCVQRWMRTKKDKQSEGGDKGASIEDCCVHFENFRRTRFENKINAIPRIKEDQTSIAPYRASLEEDVETVPGTIAARLFETTTKANAEAIATAKRPTAGAGSMGNREE